MPSHPNKHIQEAIEYAEENGWRLKKASGHAHIWGKLLCPLRSREAHAARIRRAVDNCGHAE